MKPEQAQELLNLHRATLLKADEYNAGLGVIERLLEVDKHLRRRRDDAIQSRDSRKRLVRKYGAARLAEVEADLARNRK